MENNMILITGGFGFVGSNTAQAMLDMGEDCVLAQHKNSRVPELFKDQVGKHIFIELVDVLDIETLLALGKKHKITGIVHLVTGGGVPAHPGAEAVELAADIHSTVTSISNIIQVGQKWNVKRISFASAPVVYNGITDLPWREDQLLPMMAAFPMEVAKKCGEIVANYLGRQTHVDCINLRLPAMYGPFYDPSRSSLVGRLVHAAVKGKKPDLEDIRYGSIYTEDGGDWCYIKDAARAIALLHVAGKLNHQLYNVASGHPTTNQEIVNAIKKVIPNFKIELPVRPMPYTSQAVLNWAFDITWLHEDTGYVPRFDMETGIAAYIAWLRAGNEK
jgi:UDP-glucose 4-epimerase